MAPTGATCSLSSLPLPPPPVSPTLPRRRVPRPRPSSHCTCVSRCFSPRVWAAATASSRAFGPHLHPTRSIYSNPPCVWTDVNYFSVSAAPITVPLLSAAFNLFRKLLLITRVPSAAKLSYVSQPLAFVRAVPNVGNALPILLLICLSHNCIVLNVQLQCHLL